MGWTRADMTSKFGQSALHSAAASVWNLWRRELYCWQYGKTVSTTHHSVEFEMTFFLVKNPKLKNDAKTWGNHRNTNHCISPYTLLQLITFYSSQVRSMKRRKLRCLGPYVKHGVIDSDRGPGQSFPSQFSLSVPKSDPSSGFLYSWWCVLKVSAPDT